jgi:DNA-binding Lrp family transcriptional regulator
MKIMPKRSKEKIAEDTQMIIAELQKNGKEHIDLIAKQCHISKQKLLRTITQLEKNHKIWGYTAIVDEQEQHLKKFILLLKRTGKKFNLNALDEIELHQFKNEYTPMGITIVSSYYVNGEYDWMVIFTATDLIQAKKFSTLLFDHYPGMAEKVNLMQVIFTNREHYIPSPDQTKLREFM